MRKTLAAVALAVLVPVLIASEASAHGSTYGTSSPCVFAGRAIHGVPGYSYGQTWDNGSPHCGGWRVVVRECDGSTVSKTEYDGTATTAINSSINWSDHYGLWGGAWYGFHVEHSDC